MLRHLYELRDALSLAEHFFDMVPVDEIVDEGLEIFRPQIPVVEIIAMLPYIDAENRLGAVHQRVLAIGRLHDLELAVAGHDPRPARAELGDTGIDEIGAH